MTSDPQDVYSCLLRGECEKPYSEVNNASLGSFDDTVRATQLVNEYLRISEKGGSDVRLDLGVPFRPSAWPRATARPYLWTWKIVNGYPWREDSDNHINKLELLAVLNAVKWRLRKTSAQQSRFIHLVDSQVVGAIVTKGRTSSRKLRGSVKKLCMLTLISECYPAFLFINSEDNPADTPSRYQWLHRRPRHTGAKGGTTANNKTTVKIIKHLLKTRP